MSVSVQASSIKEALELLAADIASCCGCGCCAGLRCWRERCPTGVTTSAMTGTINFNWPTITACSPCNSLLPSSVAVNDADIAYASLAPPNANCDTLGATPELEGSDWVPTTCIPGFNYTDFNLYTNGCEAQIAVFTVCEDGVAKLQFIGMLAQGCGIEAKDNPGVLDDVANDPCCPDECPDGFEVKVPMTATCEGDQLRLTGSGGGISFDLLFTLDCL